MAGEYLALDDLVPVLLLERQAEMPPDFRQALGALRQEAVTVECAEPVGEASQERSELGVVMQPRQGRDLQVGLFELLDLAEAKRKPEIPLELQEQAPRPEATPELLAGN